MSDRLTTTAGAPVADNQNSLTAGPRGPVLLEDYQLLEKLAHQNRERIAERVVHAKGWGTFGSESDAQFIEGGKRIEEGDSRGCSRCVWSRPEFAPRRGEVEDE